MATTQPTLLEQGERTRINYCSNALVMRLAIIILIFHNNINHLSTDFLHTAINYDEATIAQVERIQKEVRCNDVVESPRPCIIS